MSYDSKGTTKALYEPKTSYKIDRIEVIVDENNRFINDLPDVTTSSDARFFTDDCLLYRHVNSQNDSDLLQKDLSALGPRQWMHILVSVLPFWYKPQL
jgi:hypothetical protein